MTDHGSQLVSAVVDAVFPSSVNYIAFVRTPSLYGPQLMPISTESSESGSTKPTTGQLWPRGDLS